MDHGGVVAKGLVKRFGSFVALDERRLRASPRAPWSACSAERCRQDHDHPDPHDAAPARRRFGRRWPATTSWPRPQLVRAMIGLTGQYAAVDEDLTGRENLVLVGRLSRLPRRKALDRADELLSAFSLADAGDRALRTYSGGMRRRLDLAGSLMVSPPVLFLDEPTTGLDPRSRLELWDVISELRDQGTTIVLTTQYLEEADQLAQSISVIDGGHIIAEGTADELKAQGGRRHARPHRRRPLGCSTRRSASLTRAFGVRRDRPRGRSRPRADPDAGHVGRHRRSPRPCGPSTRDGVVVADLTLRRPSLDDVFLTLTGHAAEAERADRVVSSRGPTRVLMVNTAITVDKATGTAEQRAALPPARVLADIAPAGPAQPPQDGAQPAAHRVHHDPAADAAHPVRLRVRRGGPGRRRHRLQGLRRARGARSRR